MIVRGRGAAENPAGRFEALAYEPDPDTPPEERADPRTIFLRDATKTLIATNDSPDVSFDASFNPYRGCEHGCAYCFARPTHEYFGMSAGLDFETRILVKHGAPELLRRELASSRWKPQVLGMSGVTDPYQPAERHFRLTRRCLQVLAEFRNPVTVITKNHLVTRDVDVLAELAAHRCALVCLSVTTLDPDLARRMEPRASTPERRLDAIRALAQAGVPVGVLVAPVVPGLTDHEMPAILKACADAGACFGSYVALRLPHGVKDLFAAWLERHHPDRKEKVLNRIRELRGGKLYDSTFHVRGKGTGLFADHLESLFRLGMKKAGFPPARPELSTDAFRRPGEQLLLF